MTESQRKERERLKGETIHTNEAFAHTLKQRQADGPKDFNKTHKEALAQTAGTGHGTKPRLAVPQDVEVYMYSGQKLNVYDFQKEEMR